jgi:hypothetical protein
MLIAPTLRLVKDPELKLGLIGVVNTIMPS